MMDHLRQLSAQPNQVCARELAFEDGILKMVAETTQNLKDFPEALVVADIVADEIRSAHADYQYIGNSATLP